MKVTTTTATALAAMLASAATARDSRSFAVLHFTNKALVQARVDPIVTPGKPGTHVHNVLGGSNFGMSSTGESLKESNCSTALVKGDFSNYWYPTLYFHDPKTGDFESVEVFYSNLYYFFEATNDRVTAFPTGLQILSGNSNLRTPPVGGGGSNLDPSQGPVQPIKFTCPRGNNNFDNPPSWPANSDGTQAGIRDPGNKGEGVGFPDVNCDGYASPLRMDIHFPSCYNPKAGLTNYKENMAFPSNAGSGKADCPAGWIHTPHLFFEVYFNTPLFADRWEQGKGTQPFVLANGDGTGYGAHADFMAAWDEKLLQHIIDTCDAGDAGMDKCPGLFYGLNSAECTIGSPIDEVVEGTLKALPGNNPPTGWQYGNGDGSNTPSNGGSPAVAPAKGPALSQKPTAAAGRPATPAAPTAPAGSAPPSDNNSTGAIAGFKLAGCFEDNIGRVLSGQSLPALGPMTNYKCITHCKAAGFALAATEYGGQCYCGNQLVGSAKLKDAACSIACEGDSKDVCGGSWALSVYSQDGQASLRGAKSQRAHGHYHRRSHLH